MIYPVRLNTVPTPYQRLRPTRMQFGQGQDAVQLTEEERAFKQALSALWGAMRIRATGGSTVPEFSQLDWGIMGNGGFGCRTDKAISETIMTDFKVLNNLQEENGFLFVPNMTLSEAIPLVNFLNGMIQGNPNSPFEGVNVEYVQESPGCFFIFISPDGVNTLLHPPKKKSKRPAGPQ